MNLLEWIIFSVVLLVAVGLVYYAFFYKPSVPDMTVPTLENAISGLIYGPSVDTPFDSPNALGPLFPETEPNNGI